MYMARICIGVLRDITRRNRPQPRPGELCGVLQEFIVLEGTPTMCDSASISKVTYVTPLFENPIPVVSKIAAAYSNEVRRS